MSSRRRFRFIWAVAAIAVFAVFAVAGCSSGSSASKGSSGTSTDGTVISLKSLAFMPPDLTVHVGTKVTWRNDEPITHTVTSGTVSGVDSSSGLRTDQKADGMFNATLKGKGATFSYTFTKTGTYTYYCSIHFGMNAKIIVTS